MLDLVFRLLIHIKKENYQKNKKYTMAHYSIKDVEHLSGVKAHTLRIWEQRYDIFQPHRTDTNIRYYSDEDLKIIICISALISQGYKIGNIAKMTKSSIQEHLQNIANKDYSFDIQIKALTTAMIDVDEPYFEKIINIAIASIGFEDTMINVIFPFLERIGIMWLTGAVNPAQEHFISNLIRQKIIAAIDKLEVNEHLPQKKYLLYLPEGEMHEISLLFLAFLLKKRNNRITYLGANVPLGDVVSVTKHAKPHYTCSIFTANPANDVEGYVNHLGANAPESEHLFAGQRFSNLNIEMPDNCQYISSIQNMLDFINANSAPLIIHQQQSDNSEQSATGAADSINTTYQ